MILCLSGWGQKFDSLNIIFKDQIFDPIFFEKNQIIHLNYSEFNNISDFFTAIKKLTPKPRSIIGWSLGGQLAIRLIANNIISPQNLFLIAPPFQLVKNDKINTAMSRKTYDEFYNNFTKSPTQTLKKFAILSAMNDKNAKEIAKNLEITDENSNNLKFWLEELERFSCFDINFNNFPKTLFFQGKGDMIVHPNQSLYFQERITNFALVNIANSGHAPHLSNNIISHKIYNQLHNS